MPDGAAIASWLPRGMREDAAAFYVGLSVSMMRNELRAGRFPASVRLTRGRIVWLREDLDHWLDEKAGRANPVRAPADPDRASDWDLALGGDRAA